MLKRAILRVLALWKLVVITLWCREVNDVAILLEHVDLLNSLNWLNVQLLESGLELLVIVLG